MADKGIIFSAPMVRALLAGRKTQTRRLLTSARVFSTPESRAFTLKGSDLARALQGADRWRHLGGTGWFWEADAFEHQAPATRTGWMANLPYAPGDRLYVREAHAIDGARSWYRLDHEEALARGPRVDVRWRPSIHMPRWASRLTLTVTGVRVERVGEISEADADAEGVETDLWDMAPVARDYSHDEAWFVGWSMGVMPPSTSVEADRVCRDSFRSLWNSLHTKPGERFEDSPWVVAITFDVRKGNIDA